MIGGDASTPPIWRTVLTEFRLHATSASGANDATVALRNGVFAAQGAALRCIENILAGLDAATARPGTVWQVARTADAGVTGRTAPLPW